MKPLLRVLLVVISLCSIVQHRPVHGADVGRDDVRNLYSLYKKLLDRKRDLLDSAYVGTADPKNILCLVDLMTALDDIEENVATAFYFSIVANKISSPTDQRTTASMAQSSVRDFAKDLVEQRSAINKILGRCVGTPLAVLKGQEILGLIGEAESTFRTLGVRLSGSR
jgi:hypothetical protein